MDGMNEKGIIQSSQSTHVCLIHQHLNYKRLTTLVLHCCAGHTLIRSNETADYEARNSPCPLLAIDEVATGNSVVRPWYFEISARAIGRKLALFQCRQEIV